MLFRNPDRRSRPLTDRFVTLLAPLPQPARRSIAAERRSRVRLVARARRRHRHEGRGSDDPQAPWQKGAIENLNRWARRWLPRDTPVAALADDAMNSICERLNSTPRKCLGYRTPAEAFRQEPRRVT